jgi:hypothetical protein
MRIEPSRRDWRFAYIVFVLSLLAAVMPVFEILLGTADLLVAFASGVFWAFILICVLSVWTSRKWARVAWRRAEKIGPAGTVWLVKARNPDRASATCVVTGSDAGLNFQSKTNSSTLPTGQIDHIAFGTSGILQLTTARLVTTGGEVIHLHPLRPDAVLVESAAVEKMVEEMRKMLHFSK